MCLYIIFMTPCTNAASWKTQRNISTIVWTFYNEIGSDLIILPLSTTASVVGVSSAWRPLNVAFRSTAVWRGRPTPPEVSGSQERVRVWIPDETTNMKCTDIKLLIWAQKPHLTPKADGKRLKLPSADWRCRLCSFQWTKPLRTSSFCPTRKGKVQVERHLLSTVVCSEWLCSQIRA